MPRSTLVVCNYAHPIEQQFLINQEILIGLHYVYQVLLDSFSTRSKILVQVARFVHISYCVTKHPLFLLRGKHDFLQLNINLISYHVIIISPFHEFSK